MLNSDNKDISKKKENKSINENEGIYIEENENANEMDKEINSFKIIENENDGNKNINKLK
jgi:hypothetical protein